MKRKSLLMLLFSSQIPNAWLSLIVQNFMKRNRIVLIGNRKDGLCFHFLRKNAVKGLYSLFMYIFALHSDSFVYISTESQNHWGIRRLAHSFCPLFLQKKKLMMPKCIPSLFYILRNTIKQLLQ